MTLEICEHLYSQLSLWSVEYFLQFVILLRHFTNGVSGKMPNGHLCWSMQHIAYIFQYECPLFCVVLRRTSIFIYIYVSVTLYGIVEVFSLCIVEFPLLFVCVFKTAYHKANKNGCELQNCFTHSNCFLHTVNAFTRLASLLPNNLAQAVMIVKLFFREILGCNLGRYSACNVWSSYIFRCRGVRFDTSTWNMGGGLW